MLQQPEEALKDLGRGIITHHYSIIDEKKGALCSSAEKKISKNSLENIIHLCTLIYDLRPDIKEITLNNRMLNGLEVIGKKIIDIVIKEAVKTGNLQRCDSELIKQVKKFALSGILEEYASIVLKNTVYDKIIANVKKIWSEGQTVYSDTELALILGHSICNDRRIPVHGKVYDSPEIFQKEMKHLAEKDRNAYMEFTQKAKTDLNFLEKMLPDTDSRKAITEALAESTYAIFGDNEYFFKNGEDFENFIDKLVQEEKPYELQGLYYSYKTPLRDVSKKVWNTDFRTKLEKIVSGFIHIGEHLFTGEEACRKFLNEVRERGQKEPAYLLGFIKAHKESLDRATKSFPRINDAVSKLYNSGKNVIALNEHLFPGITEFKNFIDTVTAHAHKDPGYLLDFMRRHKNALEALESNESISNITEPLNKAFAELISFDNRIFTNVQDFNAHIDSIIKLGENNPRYLVSYTRNHRQEIFDIRNKDNRCHEALNRLMNERNRIVSFDEYVFPTVDEFRSFIDEVLQRGQQDPSYLKRFIRIHEKALTLLNGVSSLTSFVKPVLDAGNKVIELDEYTFSNANDFNSFVSKLSCEDHNKTQRIANFAKEHHDSLITIENNASVAIQITNLLKAENNRVKEKAISVNGVKYTPITMKKGDIIKFGSYPQDGNGRKSPIEWLILDVKENEAFLISSYGLDCMQYNELNTSITWEDCDLRKWLNNVFIKSAFSEEEFKRIKVSELENKKNCTFGLRGGNSTSDRIFCLSIDEAEQYFTSDNYRKCQPTAYARRQNANANINNGCCYWWLRSPSSFQNHTPIVTSDGTFDRIGPNVSDDYGVVRPALRIIF